MNKPELLSPAGSREAMIAAVQNGADAVYLGGSGFNARRAAENFDDKKLAEAISYCHLRGVRVYVAMNTLILPDEWERALRFGRYLEDIGADAVILQDIGLSGALGQIAPNLKRHASTQMAVHAPEGARQAKQMGFSRVILARETPIGDMRQMAEAGDIELECFVHGALCVSVSGQCLFSGMIGGRSGNRGRCAQPCRLPYRLERDGAAGPECYPLSTRDLCTLSELEKIFASGVHSLKIEGRLKRPEYVAIVTQTYRRALDAIAESGINPVGPPDIERLERIFHRGHFTRGLMFSVPDKDFVFTERPNNGGWPVGEVIRALPGKAEILLSEAVRRGDGVEFRGGQRETGAEIVYIEKGGKRLDSAEAGERVILPVPPGAQKGQRVFRTSDSALLAQARDSYREERRFTKLSGSFTARIGQRPRLELICDGGRVFIEGQAPCEMSATRNLTREEAIKQLSRLGGTVYAIDRLTVHIDPDVFLPLSALNALRRAAVEEMDALLIGKKPVGGPALVFSGHSKIASPGKAVLSVQSPDAGLLARAQGVGAGRLYYAPRDYRYIDESGLSRLDPKPYLLLPPVSFAMDLEELDRMLARGQGLFSGLALGSLGQIGIADKYYRGAFLADYPLYVCNPASAESLKERGAQICTLSPELTAGQMLNIREHSPLEAEYIAYGRLPLMNLKYCPSRRERGCPCGGAALIDRKGYRFPMRCVRQSGRLTQIYNPLPICLIGEMDKLPGISQRLIFTDENAGRAIRIIRLFADTLAGRRPDEAFLKELRDEGWTTGHIKRGVE